MQKTLWNIGKGALVMIAFAVAVYGFNPGTKPTGYQMMQTGGHANI